MSFKKQGNEHVKVFVRCRPLLKSEFGHSVPVEVHPEVNKILVRDSGTDRCTVKTFTFDKVFGPEAKQADIYAAVVAPVVNEVMKGFNCTVFAYGQTGTGKTFTIEGGKSENFQKGVEDPLSGVIPRAMSHIFNDLSSLKTDPDICVSFLELYNEEIFDLLSNSEDLVKLKMFDNSSQKGSVVVQGLKKVPLTSMAEVYAILEEGCRKRRKASTLLNQMSSRSHTIFTVTVHIKESSSTLDKSRTGKLNLVDLAGSENIGRSGALRKTAREAGNINQSLLALGRVITSLCEKAVHIPYRESKLTRLLRDSLGGQTKTAVIATISPSAAHLEETHNSLEFAMRAKSITIKPEVNTQVSVTSLTKDYLDEISRIKKAIKSSLYKTGFYATEEYLRSKETSLEMKREDKFQVMTQIENLTKENRIIDETILEGNNALADKRKKVDATRELKEKLKEELKQLTEERKLDEAMYSVLEPVCSHLHGKLHEDLEQGAVLESEVKNMKSQSQMILDEQESLQQQIQDLQANRTRKIEILKHNFEDLCSKVKDMHGHVNFAAGECNNCVSTLQANSESAYNMCDQELENIFKCMKDLENVNVCFKESTASLLEEAKIAKLKWIDDWEVTYASSSETAILDPIYKALEDCRLRLVNISKSFKDWKRDLTSQAYTRQKLLKDHLDNQKQDLKSTTECVNALFVDLKKNFDAYNKIIVKSNTTQEINKKLWSERFLAIEKAICSLDVFCTEHVSNEIEITTQARSVLNNFSSNGRTVANTLTTYCASTCQNMDALLKELDLQEKDVCMDKLKGMKQEVDSCARYKDLNNSVAKCSTSFQDITGYRSGMANTLVSELEQNSAECTQKASDSLLQSGEKSLKSLADTQRQVDMYFSKNASSTEKLKSFSNTLSETSENEISAFAQCIESSVKYVAEGSPKGDVSSRMNSSEIQSFSMSAQQETLRSSVFLDETKGHKECPFCWDKLADKTLKDEKMCVPSQIPFDSSFRPRADSEHLEPNYFSALSSGGQQTKSFRKKGIHSARKHLQFFDVEGLCAKISTISDEED